MWKKGSKESKINRKDRMSQFVYYYTIIYTTTATAAVSRSIAVLCYWGEGEEKGGAAPRPCCPAALLPSCPAQPCHCVPLCCPAPACPAEDNMGVSIEFCGGTHVASTAQARAFALLTEEGIAKGIR